MNFEPSNRAVARHLESVLFGFLLELIIKYPEVTWSIVGSRHNAY